jgi:hypothetical protein
MDVEDGARLCADCAYGAALTHDWSQGEFCSCGSDVCVCQGCGRAVCGAIAVWTAISVVADAPPVIRRGNVGPCCFSRFGLGHQGVQK